MASATEDTSAGVAQWRHFFLVIFVRRNSGIVATLRISTFQSAWRCEAEGLLWMLKAFLYISLWLKKTSVGTLDALPVIFLRGHEGVKPYVCCEFLKRFCTADQLKIHPMIHWDIWWFAVGFCAEVYNAFRHFPIWC